MNFPYQDDAPDYEELKIEYELKKQEQLEERAAERKVSLLHHRH